MFIKGIITSCIDNHAPLKEVPLKKSNKIPWIDKAYTCLTKKRDILLNKCNLSYSSVLFEEYKKIRNKCTSLFHSNKSLYFKNFCNNTSTSCKKLWKKLDPYLNPNKKSTLISSVILNNSSLNTDLHLANSFSNYFSSITNSFKFVSIENCHSFIDKFFDSNPQINHQNNPNKLEINKLNGSDVLKGLKDLKPDSGTGESGIESSILIYGAEALSEIITNLFNLIISTCTFPDEWKCAHITPIYKGGKKTELGNYRPISILSPLSKLFESLLAEIILNYLELNNMLNPNQFAYRKSLSTEHAVIAMIDEWRKSLDLGEDIIALLLDLSKAFDTVDHSILLKKLHYLNFHPNLIKLIESYLSNRSIKVNINGTLSESRPLNVTSRVGSRTSTIPHLH